LSKSLLFDRYELADLKPQRLVTLSGRSQGVLDNNPIIMF